VGAPSAATSDFLRVSARHRTLALAIAALALLENLLLIGLVVGLHLGLRGMLYARLGAQSAVLLAQLLLTREIWRGELDRRLLLPLLRLGLPIGVLHALVAARALDRLVIARLSTLAHAGEYELAARAAAPIALANLALELMLEPVAYRNRNDPALLTGL